MCLIHVSTNVTALMNGQERIGDPSWSRSAVYNNSNAIQRLDPN